MRAAYQLAHELLANSIHPGSQATLRSTYEHFVDCVVLRDRAIAYAHSRSFEWMIERASGFGSYDSQKVGSGAPSASSTSWLVPSCPSPTFDQIEPEAPRVCPYEYQVSSPAFMAPSEHPEDPEGTNIMWELVGRLYSTISWRRFEMLGAAVIKYFTPNLIATPYINGLDA